MPPLPGSVSLSPGSEEMAAAEEANEPEGQPSARATDDEDSGDDE